MIELTHEEWFKVYMILDNLNPSEKYHKNFLLFVEAWKQMLYDTMKVYVSTTESINYDHTSDFHTYRDTLIKLDDDEEAVNELNKNNIELIQEVNSLHHEIDSIVKSVVKLPKILIPKHLVPELDSEQMEVLSVLIEESNNENN